MLKDERFRPVVITREVVRMFENDFGIFSNFSFFLIFSTLAIK